MRATASSRTASGATGLPGLPALAPVAVASPPGIGTCSWPHAMEAWSVIRGKRRRWRRATRSRVSQNVGTALGESGWSGLPAQRHALAATNPGAETFSFLPTTAASLPLGCKRSSKRASTCQSAPMQPLFWIVQSPTGDCGLTAAAAVMACGSGIALCRSLQRTEESRARRSYEKSRLATQRWTRRSLRTVLARRLSSQWTVSWQSGETGLPAL
mmetsp:Transcript_1284/g.2922  ORF Transcript_1284/g.2922 Transcript_1284/m.2922 type:complete len:214 (+) Transcript_1284:1040-1681(+)